MKNLAIYPLVFTAFFSGAAFKNESIFPNSGPTDPPNIPTDAPIVVQFESNQREFSHVSKSWAVVRELEISTETSTFFILKSKERSSAFLSKMKLTGDEIASGLLQIQDFETGQTFFVQFQNLKIRAISEFQDEKTPVGLERISIHFEKFYAWRAERGGVRQIPTTDFMKIWKKKEAMAMGQ